MSISYTAQVVLGFKLDIKKVYQKRTKYDPDTGSPYVVNMHVHDDARVDGVFIASSIEDQYLFRGDGEIEGLNLYHSGYEHGTTCLGVCLGMVGEEDTAFAELVVPDRDSVDAFAAKYGVTPKTFLLLSAG